MVFVLVVVNVVLLVDPRNLSLKFGQNRFRDILNIVVVHVVVVIDTRALPLKFGKKLGHL